MPITVAKFRRSRSEPPAEPSIKHFLRQHPDLAYTALEVAEALGLMKGMDVWADTLTLNHTSNTLMTMADRRKINGKNVLGEMYYRAKGK